MIQRGRHRVVFDCNCLIQAVAHQTGSAVDAYHVARSAECQLFVSKTTILEFRRVIASPPVLAISPSITPEGIERFLEELLTRATLIRSVRRSFSFSRDPDDEPYLDLCLQVGADYLVTYDRDLLSLMTDHTLFAKEFRQKTHPLKIVKPAKFLEHITPPKRSAGR